MISNDTIKRALLEKQFYDFHQRNTLDFIDYNYLKKFDDFKSRFYILFVLIFIFIYIAVVDSGENQALLNLKMSNDTLKKY